MNLEQTKAEFRKLVSEINSGNSHEYYDRIGDVVKKNRDSGGLGKPIQDFLSELDNEFGDVDDWKKNILLTLAIVLLDLLLRFVELIFQTLI